MRQQFRLIDQVEQKRSCGDTITLGLCYRCGRAVRLSMATKNGSRCRYDGTRYDKNGNAEGDPDFGK